MADMLSLNDCCSQNLNHVVCLRVINIDDLHDDVVGDKRRRAASRRLQRLPN